MGKLLGEEVGVSGVENTLVLVSNRDRVKRRDEAVPCLNIESNIQPSQPTLFFYNHEYQKRVPSSFAFQAFQKKRKAKMVSPTLFFSHCCDCKFDRTRIGEQISAFSRLDFSIVSLLGISTGYLTLKCFF